MTKRVLFGVEVEAGRTPAHTEALYREKWLKKHLEQKADVIVCDEITRMPVRAEYKYPLDFEHEVKEKSFIVEEEGVL